jgi:hypothetical protein
VRKRRIPDLAPGDLITLAYGADFGERVMPRVVLDDDHGRPNLTNHVYPEVHPDDILLIMEVTQAAAIKLWSHRYGFVWEDDVGNVNVLISRVE